MTGYTQPDLVLISLTLSLFNLSNIARFRLAYSIIFSYIPIFYCVQTQMDTLIIKKILYTYKTSIEIVFQKIGTAINFYFQIESNAFIWHIFSCLVALTTKIKLFKTSFQNIYIHFCCCFFLNILEVKSLPLTNRFLNFFVILPFCIILLIKLDFKAELNSAKSLLNHRIYIPVKQYFSLLCES